MVAIIQVIACQNDGANEEESSSQHFSPITKIVHGSLHVGMISVGPLETNVYIVWDETTKNAVIIDPGDEAQKVVQAAKALSVKVTEVISTHAHGDHVGAAQEITDMFQAPFALHKGAKGTLRYQAEKFRAANISIPAIDRWLEDGNVVKVGSIKGKVIHTPGHSLGSICLYFENEKILFSGDTLFQGSIGRTDFFGGSREHIFSSINKRLLTLGDKVKVYPGHGAHTSIRIEKMLNPFLR